VEYLNKFLIEYAANYKDIMKEKPARSEWDYERNLSIYTTFEMLLNHKLLRDELSHRHIMILLSFLGLGEIPIDLISQQDPVGQPILRTADVRFNHNSTSGAIFLDLCHWSRRVAKAKCLLLRLSLSRLEDFFLVHVRKHLPKAPLAFLSMPQYILGLQVHQTTMKKLYGPYLPLH
jgi:hypothetical protein